MKPISPTTQNTALVTMDQSRNVLRGPWIRASQTKAVFCVVGLIGFMVTPLISTVILQPFRMTVFFQWIGALYLARYAWSLLCEPMLVRRLSGVVLLVGLVIERYQHKGKNCAAKDPNARLTGGNNCSLA